jgi:hypothetical protein
MRFTKESEKCHPGATLSPAVHIRSPLKRISGKSVFQFARFGMRFAFLLLRQINF